MKFTCDPSSIDKEIDCNCFSPCDEVVYDANIVISDYQKDEIEKTKTEKYGKLIVTFDLLAYFHFSIISVIL
jgi:hypothetical protein